MSNKNDVKHCYLVSYRHVDGAGHCEVQRDCPWLPYASVAIADEIASKAGLDDVVITSVFYQGCYPAGELVKFKQRADQENAE